MAARGDQGRPAGGDRGRTSGGDGTPRDGDRARSGGADRARGVYMISVAAELAGMHPQTLRIYEQRGLIAPKRSPKNTRLYSDDDVERLRRIQELTNELGMNLAGVERVFELEEQVARLNRRIRNLERQSERAQAELEDEIERVRRSFKAELVPYEPPEQALAPARGVRVRVHRRR